VRLEEYGVGAELVDASWSKLLALALVMDESTPFAGALPVLFEGQKQVYLINVRLMRDERVAEGENWTAPHAFAFWKENDTMPLLRRLARVLFAIPPSTADVERTFSASGRVGTSVRSRLLPSTLEILTVIRRFILRKEFSCLSSYDALMSRAEHLVPQQVEANRTEWRAAQRSADASSEESE
jgi:hypothetical protein